LLIEEDGAEKIIKSAAVWNLGDLGVGRGDCAVRLLLRQIGIHQPSQSICGRWIVLKALLVGVLGLAVLSLRQPKITHLDVAHRALRCYFDALANVLLRSVELSPVDIRNRAQVETISRARL